MFISFHTNTYVQSGGQELTKCEVLEYNNYYVFDWKSDFGFFEEKILDLFCLQS